MSSSTDSYLGHDTGEEEVRNGGGEAGVREALEGVRASCEVGLGLSARVPVVLVADEQVLEAGDLVAEAEVDRAGRAVAVLG